MVAGSNGSIWLVTDWTCRALGSGSAERLLLAESSRWLTVNMQAVAYLRGMMRLIATALGIIVLPAVSAAHHSRVEFSDIVQVLEGELIDVVWLNPHPALFLRVDSDTGEQETWRVEAHTGIRVYNRMGVTADLFNVGDRLTVAGRLSARRDYHLLGTNVLLADNREVLLSRDDPPYWPGRPVVGTDGIVPIDEETLQSAASENRGLFRVWSVAPNSQRQHFPFSEAALAGRAGWDPADNSIARCEQPGMPVTMGAPLPIEFFDDGAVITLHAVYFDTYRKIHIDGATDTQNQPASHLGYSVGHWEGNTLVVETTGINYPYIDNEARTPQSEAVEVTERFTLSTDQSNLDFQMTITDPVTFTEPATRERNYLAIGEPFVALDCHVF